MTPTLPDFDQWLAARLESERPPLLPMPPSRAKPDDPAGDLRLKLAVRGWARPLDLIEPGRSPDEVAAILGALAPEVEIAVQTRPSQWYLSLATRKRELARHEPARLRAAARTQHPSDGQDPVLRAMQIALADDEPALADLDPQVLAALGNACDWLGDGWRHVANAQSIAAALGAKALDADLARMTESPLVGRRHRQVLGQLIEFATAKEQEPLRVAYLYGGGGAGKTTLLSFLQRELRERVPVARIDFDEPAIDPARTVTLNLALIEQLARIVPSLRARAADALSALRETALVQHDAGLARPASRKRDKQATRPASMLKAESVVSEAASDEGSILYRLLAADTVPGPILIVFDTAELVLAQSDHVAGNLVAWLDFLKNEAGARDLRLVVAGRDPPDEQDTGLAAKDLLSRLRRAGARVEAPVGLPELEPAEAAELLRHCGVDDATVAAEAAAAVPGNPLLLRITADALRQGDGELRESVRKAHRDSRIDADSARNYLLRRVVAHVRDPVARPYVLAAAYSPIVTAKLLEEVVIPAVDRSERVSRSSPAPAAAANAMSTHRSAVAKAERVFRALASTHWLTRPTLSADAVPFNREVRGFALKLLAALPNSAALERDVRQSAAIHHLRRRSASDRALALYHLALLGHPYTVPRNLASVQTVLRDAIEELPAQLRHRLAPPPGGVALGPGLGRIDDMNDSDWQRYLEGDERSGRAGEGAQMVKADRAREALDLYLARPTRPPGLPPTFVIQAQADLGEWDERITDIDAILEREADDWLRRKSLGPEALSRIYWITRLALQAHGRLSSPHAALLRDASETATGPGLSTLPALLAIAEAIHGEPIMAGRMRAQALKTDAAGRTLLSPFRGSVPATLDLFDAGIAVVQSDWLQRVALMQEAMPNPADVARLRELQSRIDALHARPIAQVNQLFNKMRERVRIEPAAVRDPDGAVLLFRGLVPEFHRPLREALLALCENGTADQELRGLVDAAFNRMSIRPAELEPSIFYRRLRVNPRAWCTAFISYADRCRLLPGVCELLARYSGDKKIGRIASSFLAWESALFRGTPSDWTQSAERWK